MAEVLLARRGVALALVRVAIQEIIVKQQPLARLEQTAKLAKTVDP